MPPNEYTVLAAIVCDYKNGQNKQVVALSTGTKCFPSNECLKKERIVDCHSESLLKRAFKRHLISVLDRSDSQLDNISSLDLFVTQLPCGAVQRWEGHHSQQLTTRKPGRGDACLRATCLKKITKWAFMGLQGKTLLQFTKHPILINNIVIGNCGPIGEYNQQMVDNWFTLEDDCICYDPFLFTHNLPKIKFCEKFRNNLFVKSDSNQSTPTSVVMWKSGIH